MPVTPTYPGVYIVEESSGVRPIESASTSTACFIGPTIIQDAELKGKAKLITRWADYKTFFGFPDITATDKEAEVAVTVKEKKVTAKVAGKNVTSTIDSTVGKDKKEVAFNITATVDEGEEDEKEVAFKIIVYMVTRVSCTVTINS